MARHADNVRTLSRNMVLAYEELSMCVAPKCDYLNWAPLPRICYIGFKGQTRHIIHIGLEQEPVLQPILNCEIDGIGRVMTNAFAANRRFDRKADLSLVQRSCDPKAAVE